MRQMLMAMFALLSLDALSQPSLPPGVRGPVTGLATRSVSTYLALERNLLDALIDGSRDAVARMLGDDFEVRLAASVDPVSAADWLKDQLGSGIESGNVRNLNVREYDGIAVVSFLLDSRRRVQRKTVASTHYVVDVWRQSPQQLVGRYVAKPGQTPPIPVRPTGRE